MAEIRTTRFEAAHGRSPKGRGLWMFETKFPGEIVTTWTGTYSAAKRIAIRDAKARQIDVLYVCP